MLDKLPFDIITSEICSKNLNLTDIVQVGIALNQNSSGIFNPERVYPRDKWTENGYDPAFYDTLIDCLNQRKTLADKLYKTEKTIGRAYEVMEQIGSRKDVEVFEVLKETFEIEKLVSLSFLSWGSMGLMVQT